MASYFQMGHNTENLIGEKDLDDFKGIILSPLNRDPCELKKDINDFRRKGSYDIILDSQLYLPLSDRGKLPKHPYFPSDFDSADRSSVYWWEKILNPLCNLSEELGVDAVTSPIFLPKIFRSDYFSLCTDISQLLFEKLNNKGIKVLTTVMTDLNILTNQDLILETASILSDADTTGYYIVLVSEMDPRREFSDSEELFGVMSLVNELKRTGRRVIVSHCSSDMLLFKAAGATHCATGKYFNLRRFTKSRFEEPSGGGGQLPYWFEHSLIAFIRQADVKRLKSKGFENMIETEASGNYWSKKIIENWIASPKKAWIGNGWRQYLSWFGKTEAILSKVDAIEKVKGWLHTAESNWLSLEDNEILMEEPRNDGKWLRPWRQALNKFSKIL